LVTVASLAALLAALPAAAVPLDVFEIAYVKWSNEQRTEAKVYGKMPVTRPPASTGNPTEKKVNSGSAAHSTTSLGANRRAMEEDASSSSSSSSEVGDYDGAGNADQRVTSVPLKSFTEACGTQSELLCDEPNPFQTSFCLLQKKSQLSRTCAEYVSGKVSCFTAVRSLGCMTGTSHLACLNAYRYRSSVLPAPCSRTSFFAYVSHGPSQVDFDNEKKALETNKNAV
jgi:hypothetical protein